MKKDGFLSKFIDVKEDTEEALEQLKQYNEETVIEEEDTNVSQLGTNIDTSNLISISDIYNAALLNNKPITVYKLSDLLHTLPNTMPQQIQRDTIKGILTAMNIELTDLLLDGETRIKAIQEAASSFSNTTKEQLSTYNQQIKELMSELETVKLAMSDREKLQEEQNILFLNEVEDIENIINFMKGEKE